VHVRRAWVALVLLCPIAFVGDHAGWSRVWIFILAGVGTIPAAAVLGLSTEQIAFGITAREIRAQRASGEPIRVTTLGAKVGGLLNATFGNVPELFIGILALHQGYIRLTQATIAGSVIGNASLVLGISLFLGGIRHGQQRFDSREAVHHAVLMALAVTSLMLPSIFAATNSGDLTAHISTVHISVIAAVLLLVVYGAYLLFSLFRWQGGGKSNGAKTFIDDEAAALHDLREDVRHPWPLLNSFAATAGVTALLFLSSEALVDTIGPFTRGFGWSPFFVGIVVVPILGNMAEQSSAIMFAYKNRVDTALGIASGSSIQVAVFVAPILVIASQFMTSMTLAFNPIEIAVLAMVVVVFFFVAQDGESNWLEGLQLMVLYALAATVFFYVPGTLR
jgi:Ca2+:H+ antiporter